MIPPTVDATLRSVVLMSVVSHIDSLRVPRDENVLIMQYGYCLRDKEGNDNIIPLLCFLSIKNGLYKQLMIMLCFLFLFTDDN